MNKQQIIKNHTDVIFTKLFEMVNLDYKTVWKEYKDDPDWFTRNKWSAAKQVEFIEWLMGYFENNKGARRGLLSMPWKSRKRCYMAAVEFTLHYGWELE